MTYIYMYVIRLGGAIIYVAIDTVELAMIHGTNRLCNTIIIGKTNVRKTGCILLWMYVVF